MVSRMNGPPLCTPSGRASSDTARGVGSRWKLSKPLFIALSVGPIAKTLTITPTMTATCCFHGVAPIR